MPSRPIRHADSLSSRAAWFVAALVAPLTLSGVASADVTCGDKTCGKGFVCETHQSACPAIATANGETVPCPTTLDYECVLGPCSVDSDCGDAMVCHTDTTSQCNDTTAPACDPAASDCAAVEVAAADCTTTATQQCLPRYLLPCSIASDCGPGFTCEEEIMGSCSGSAGSVGSTPVSTNSGTSNGADPIAPGDAATGGATGMAAPDPEATPDAVAPDSGEVCSEVPTGRFSCVLQSITCTGDAECPTGLVCVENSTGSCWANSDGSRGCDPVEPSKRCQPPSYASLSGGVRQAESASTSPGASLPPRTDDTKAGDSALDSDALGEEDGAVPNSANASTGGCSLGRSRGVPAAPWMTVLLAFGLGLGMRKRRSQP